MRVLLIGDRLSFNGRSSYALSLAHGLKEAGADIQFCLLGGDLRPKLDELGIESYVVKFNVFSFRTLSRFLAEFRPDIVHLTSEQATRPGRRIAHALKRPYTVTVHDLLEAENLSLHSDEIQAVIVANESLREMLVNRLSVPKHKIRLVAKGVDLAAFDLPPVDFAGRYAVVACVGRMVPGKGHAHFLHAARQVLDSGHEALFLMIGQGPEERRLRRLLGELNLGPQVTISTPIREPRDLYRVVDILVLPATKAASSTTALEGMAARRPVIASMVGDLLHLVRNEENALAVEPGNPEGIARAIVRLLDDPAFARELGERAHEFVSRRFPQARMIEGTMALYEEILRGDFPRR